MYFATRIYSYVWFSDGKKRPTASFYKNGVLKNFAIFTGKHLLIKFSCEYCEIFKNTYFEENLQTAASGSKIGKKRVNVLKPTLEKKLQQICKKK